MLDRKNYIDKEHRFNSQKLLWHMDRVNDYFVKHKRIAPIYIDMGVTKFCNASCKFCYGRWQHMTGEMIEREALIGLFRDAYGVGIKGIGLIGDGEPTLNPAIYDAMDVGKATGLDIAISTNGIALDTDDKMVNVLKNCTWMRFNISAGTKEGYKIVHGVDQFNRVIGHIKRMVYLKRNHNFSCEIGFQSVFVPPLMMDELIPEAQLAIDLGVDYFLIKQCSLPDEGESGMIQFDLNDYDNEKVIKLLEQAESMSTNKTKIIPKWALMELKGVRPYEKCLGIPLLCQISGNGKIFPCGHLFTNEKFCMGDLHKNSIGEIIKSEQYWDVIRIMETEFDILTDCKGQCRQDMANKFIWEFTQEIPKGINFI